MLGDAFLKPEDAVESWDVRPGEKIADFGCGSGFFTIPIAQRVGAADTVYAIDVRDEALSTTRSKAKLFRLTNIEYLRADLERARGTGLKDESIDKIIVTNVLFQVDDKVALIGEAFRILKPGGSVLLVEWNAENPGGGPVLPRTVDRKEAETLLTQQHLNLLKDFYAGSHHYGLLFKKSA